MPGMGMGMPPGPGKAQTPRLVLFKSPFPFPVLGTPTHHLGDEVVFTRTLSLLTIIPDSASGRLSKKILLPNN